MMRSALPEKKIVRTKGLVIKNKSVSDRGEACQYRKSMKYLEGVHHKYRQKRGTSVMQKRSRQPHCSVQSFMYL